MPDGSDLFKQYLMANPPRAQVQAPAPLAALAQRAQPYLPAPSANYRIDQTPAPGQGGRYRGYMGGTAFMPGYADGFWGGVATDAFGTDSLAGQALGEGPLAEGAAGAALEKGLGDAASGGQKAALDVAKTAITKGNVTGNEAGSAVGSAAGTALGTAFGGPLGGAIGGAVGSAAGDALGGAIGGRRSQPLQATFLNKGTPMVGYADGGARVAAQADAIRRLQEQGVSNADIGKYLKNEIQAIGAPPTPTNTAIQQATAGGGIDAMAIPAVADAARAVQQRTAATRDIARQAFGEEEEARAWKSGVDRYKGFQEGVPAAAAAPLADPNAFSPQDWTRAHEGYRNDVYLDTLGKPTVGVGHLVSESSPFYGKKVGDKIDDKVLEDQYAKDYTHHEDIAKKGFKNFDKHPQHVQDALVNMTFQMGTKPSKWNDFNHELAGALESGDYTAASKAAADSKWFNEQTPERARSVLDRLRSGSEGAYTGLSDFDYGGYKRQ